MTTTGRGQEVTRPATKLDTFEGRSRFTTWANRFAILPAATEVRRREWARREVSPDAVELGCEAGPAPEQQAEAADVARAVRDGGGQVSGSRSCP
jgi:RNA polymerase sigma-70 factor (ECF subfamily)